MQALTDAERAILKSRFQAGADGHSQQVVMTALATPVSLHNPYMISAALLPSGQVGLLLRGLDSPYTPGSEKIYFIAYSTEHSVQSTIELFSFSSIVLDIATYYPIGTSLGSSNSGIVVAIAWEAATSKIWMRTSNDSGSSWSVAVQVPAAVTFAANTVTWNGTGARPAVHLKTNFNQDELYLFFINNATKHVRYRKTTDPDPTIGWSADTDSGFTIPSVGRNYGGSFNGNQGDTRSYVIVQTDSGVNWIIGAESDDGDFHANHAFFKGTLGGAWTRKLNDSHGGGLSGNQGANGGVFLDYGYTPTAIIGYAMSNDGVQVTWWRSLDDGETWTADNDVFSIGGSIGNMGAGAGLYVDGWSAKRYIWGGEAGLAKTPEALNRLLVDKIDVLPTSNIIRAIIIKGTAVGTSVDVSDRVIAISLDKDSSLDADTFNLDLHNEDQAFDLEDTSAVLNSHAQPNTTVDIYQWYGDVANKLQTFHGSVDSARQHDTPRTITITGRGAGSKKLLVQSVRLIGSQDLEVENHIRNMSNFVYLNKTANEILTHVLGYAGIPSSKMDFVTNTFFFTELRGDDLVSLMDLAKRVCELAGLELWEDEVGVFHTRNYGQARSSVWTYRAGEDITSLDPDTDDDTLKTRVRVLGKANAGAKYLAEIAKWAGPKEEGFAHGIAALAYDPSTKKLWALLQDGDLYLLDPSDVENGGQMPIVAGPYATGLTYPDGIAVDPLDDNLWLSDGYDATIGNSVNRKFKKVSRADGTTVLLGPFTNPDGDHCAIYAWNDAGTIKPKMTTYLTKKIYTMNSTTGATISSVDLNVVVDPGVEPNPTGLAGVAGGLFVTGWDTTDFYQVGFDGNGVNTLKQPAKNSNYITTVEDSAVPDFGSVYEAFRDQPFQIVKYEPISADGADTATYAEVINQDLEQQLGGEVRIAVIIDLAISNKGQAQQVGQRQLDRLQVYAKHVTEGAIGNPAIQQGDRITIVSPSTGIGSSSDWVVTAIRADQKADDGSYLMVLVLVPYIGLGGVAT